MRILLGYSWYPSPVCVRAVTERWLARLRSRGIAVEGLPLTLDPPGPRLGWSELDAMWRRGHGKLLRLYESLARRMEEYDVFVNYNGINLHPEFVRQLPGFRVYGCFDDPESSEDLSRPVAEAYDLCLVGNIAEVETYRRWGVREARFWPLGFREEDRDPSMTRERILAGERDVPVAILCERRSPWRRERLDRYASAFPEGTYGGDGWPAGFLPEERRLEIYGRTRIGPNFHNSTGPVNFRTYVLPANGVLLLCDNKRHLGLIFEDGREAVGFDSIEEAVDLTRHYLAHDDERRAIAAAGWERSLRDYGEEAVFRRMIACVEEVRAAAAARRCEPVPFLRLHRRRTRIPRLGHHVLAAPGRAARLLRRLLGAARPGDGGTPGPTAAARSRRETTPS
jgi:spore maturation protein CgeB